VLDSFLSPLFSDRVWQWNASRIRREVNRAAFKTEQRLRAQKVHAHLALCGGTLKDVLHPSCADCANDTLAAPPADANLVRGDVAFVTVNPGQQLTGTRRGILMLCFVNTCFVGDTAT